jgi:acetyl-CoA carboxylase biotin carboxyl carrier protein
VSLTAAEVAEIMRLLEQSDFNEISLEIGDFKVSLRRGGASSPTESIGAPSKSIAKETSVAVAPKAIAVDADTHAVASPLLGTFYRSPKPGAPPFVEVGSLVEADTVVAIIEVMKLMNTVRAGVRGKVTEILIADGALAEFGEALMHIRKVD